MATTKSDFNVYVGAETGILKGFNFGSQKPIAKNLNSLTTLQREHEITALGWGNKEKTEILVGLRNRRVRIYDTEFKGFSGCLESKVGEGPIRGIGKSNGVMVTAMENGLVKLWKAGPSEETEFNTLATGESLTKMRLSPHDSHIIATGGKENELQLWDLNSVGTCIFKARNVKNDFLDLRVPVWISDMTFLHQRTEVAISSRHGHVRLYDWKSGARRPVVDCKPQEGESWTCIASTPRENQLLLGSGKGRMILFDIRRNAVVHAYRGFAGGIREIACAPSQPIAVSVGLDRFLRIHHLDSKAPLVKIYAKSRMNNLLVADDFHIEVQDNETLEINPKPNRKRKANED